MSAPMSWRDVLSLVPLPGGEIDFSQCLVAFPQLERARTTPQSPVHHQEGDVWTHTMMVLEALVATREWPDLARADQEIVFLAALLHDVAKCSTTVIDPVTGHIGQPGHSRRGAMDARVALWDMAAPFEVREAVCRLIAVHQVPFFALADSRRGRTPEFVVRELSWQLDLRLLALLAEADMRGRISPDQARVLDDIELFRELAREDGCYGVPRRFASEHTAVSYFRGAEVYPDAALFQPPGSKVVVMSGLSASGKDTWVDEHLQGWPVVSFDDARAELGLRHGRNEGAVAHRALDKARALLRERQAFVWNATHLSAQMRARTLDLLYSYDAEVEVVYLEQPRAELLRRNRRRDSSLTNAGLLAMLHRWEPPLPTEAHRVRHLVAPPLRAS